MRCHICDSFLFNPQTDERDGKFLPCDNCLEEIEKIVSESEDDDDDDDDFYFLFRGET